MTDEEINACRNSPDDADCGRCPFRARCIKLGLAEWQRHTGLEPPEEAEE